MIHRHRMRVSNTETSALRTNANTRCQARDAVRRPSAFPPRTPIKAIGNIYIKKGGKEEENEKRSGTSRRQAEMQPPPQKNTSRKERRRKSYDERFGANPYITTSSLPSCNERYATNNPSGARRHFRFRPRGNEVRKKSPPRRHRPQPTTKPRADRPSSGSHARATSIQHAAFSPSPSARFLLSPLVLAPPYASAQEPNPMFGGGTPLLILLSPPAASFIWATPSPSI